MRAVVRLLTLLLGLSALIDSTEAQARRRPRARAASHSATAVEFADQAIRGEVPTPHFDANALFGPSGRAGGANVARARRALALIERGDRAGALQQIAGINPAVEAVEVGYVIAWVRFANGDFAGAAGALGPTLRRARLAQLPTLRRELAFMNVFAGSGVAELSAQLGDDRSVLPVADRMVEPLIAYGHLERASALLEWIEGRVRGRQLATALEHEALVDFARGSPNVGAIRLAEAIAIVRSVGDAAMLEAMRARALDAAERADSAWTLVRDSRSRIAAAVLYRVWLRSGGGPQAAAVEATVQSIERPTATAERANGAAIAPLRSAIDLRNGDVRGCYERALAVNPALRGRVVLRFTVTTAGDVTDPTIDSSASGLEETAACIATQAATWRLPAGSRTGALTITYPFALSPAD